MRRGFRDSMTFLKHRAGRLKRQVWALYLAFRSPGTPPLAKALIIVTVAYAISPIDFIPDFIPVLGYFDDLLILPALIALSIRLIPAQVMSRCRREAWKRLASGERVKSPVGIVASVLFVALWIAVVAFVVTRFVDAGVVINAVINWLHRD